MVKDFIKTSNANVDYYYIEIKFYPCLCQINFSLVPETSLGFHPSRKWILIEFIMNHGIQIYTIYVTIRSS